MCEAVSLSAREVKTEFLLQGQWKSQIQASGLSSDLVSVLQEQGRERPLTPVCNGPTLSQCPPLLKAKATRFRVILYALYLHIKDVTQLCSAGFYTDQKANPCWQLKSQMRNAVNPSCRGIFEQKSKTGFLKTSAVNFHFWTPVEHLTPLALHAREHWKHSLLMFLTLLFNTNMSMYITKPQWIEST